MRLCFSILYLLGGLTIPIQGQIIPAESFGFPTQNRRLLEEHPEKFFMGVDREGERYWQGGSFGFTRTPLLYDGKEIFTRFHEGTDIAPLKRDAEGHPLDEVMAMAEGEVVFCESPGTSGYGSQVILRHDWNCGPIYTRYAHLSRVNVATGDKIRRGQVVGIMGNTGSQFGIERAHLHLEIAFMLDSRLTKLPNKLEVHPRDRFVAMNMLPLNPEVLLKESVKGALNLPQYVGGLEKDFVVEVPSSKVPDILKRHPWLGPKEIERPPVGWEIHFTAWGLPIRFIPLAGKAPAKPTVTWVREWEGKHSWRTRQFLSGQGSAVEIGPYGKVLLPLLFNGAE